MLIFLVTLISAFSLSAQDLSESDFKGYIEINDKKIWVEYRAPKNGAPLIALLNGMTYSTEQWGEFSKSLKAQNSDFGVLKYDMRGQGRTLAPIPNSDALHLELAEVSKKFSEIHDFKTPLEYYEKLMSGELVLDTVEYFKSVNRLWGLMGQMTPTTGASADIYAEDQSKDLHELLKRFSGNNKVHLAGLSYGGAIGLQYFSEHPNMVESLTLMAPFVEKLKQQDDWVKIQMQIARTYNPILYLTPDADLYRFFFRVLVYGTYPSVEPIVLENPLKLEAMFRLAIGLKEFNGYELARSFPKRKVHLMVSLKDEYVEKEVLDKLWKELKTSGASRVYIQDGQHKIPEAMPNFAAEWMARIANEDPQLQEGKTFKRSAQVIETQVMNSLLQKGIKKGGHPKNIYGVFERQLFSTLSCRKVFRL